MQATVEVLNRDVNLKTKAVRSSIALGKKASAKCDKNDPKVFLVISSLANRTGTKFGVSANVQKVFNRCADQGMCTIRLIAPAKDIVISKADPVQLKAMLNLMKCALMAKNDEELDAINLTSAALNPASLSQVTKPKEKLIICDKRDYPITKNFPASLSILRVNDINLKKFDSRMLKLSQLTILDLSGNSIASLPSSFQGLPMLKELHLSRNKIAFLPASFFVCRSLTRSLCLLDLSKNQLKVLPSHVSNFKHLVTLNLSDNQIRKLPMTLDKLVHLRRLDLLGNKDLKVMPGCLPRMTLDHLTVSTDSMTSEDGAVLLSDSSRQVPSLLDLCLVKCYGLRTKVDESILPPSVIDYWDSIQRCHCGKLCHWSSHARGISKANPGRIARTFISDGVNSYAFIRCETLFCSTKCLDFYRNQPLNFR